MKRKMTFSLVLAIAAALFLSAQDVQEILDQHFEAIGQENLLKAKTIQTTGKAMQMGMEFPFTMIQKRPGKFRLIIDIQGSQIIQAVNGESAWAVNPMAGSADPIDLTGPEADAMKENADLDGQLWNWKEKGHQLELEGTEDVEGTEAYVLKLTKKNGNIDYFYVDSDSYLILKARAKTMMQGSEIETVTLLGNYQEVEGFVMPFNTEQQMGGQTMLTIMVEEVKVNEEVDDSIFSK